MKISLNYDQLKNFTALFASAGSVKLVAYQVMLMHFPCSAKSVYLCVRACVRACACVCVCVWCVWQLKSVNIWLDECTYTHTHTHQTKPLPIIIPLDCTPSRSVGGCLCWCHRQRVQRSYPDALLIITTPTHGQDCRASLNECCHRLQLSLIHISEPTRR